MTLTLRDYFYTLQTELAFLEEAEAQSESWLILTHLLGRSKSWLLANWRMPVPKDTIEKASKILGQRQQGHPLAYLLGDWFFMGHPIKVHRGVLIPRPETELLVDVARAYLTPNTRVIELGVGTGAIPLALLTTHPIPYDGWDISRRAIRNATENIQHLPTVHLHHQSFFAKTALWRTLVSSSTPLFLISNPPYIPRKEIPSLQREVRDYEPKRALIGGEDGLWFYRRLIQAYLRPSHPAKRTMALEVGIGQASAITDMICACPGYRCIWHQDLAGIPRVVVVLPL